ncbi:hypothetical protein, partial [Legionella jordanis]|uniref:hypothetical protein n=1 Tax=Legionella jordanis TaxID=456 RepID=UPI00399D1229
EVKQTSADDSVRLPHVKVGHRQGFIPKAAIKPLFFYPFFSPGMLILHSHSHSFHQKASWFCTPR